MSSKKKSCAAFHKFLQIKVSIKNKKGTTRLSFFFYPLHSDSHEKHNQMNCIPLRTPVSTPSTVFIDIHKFTKVEEDNVLEIEILLSLRITNSG